LYLYLDEALIGNLIGEQLTLLAYSCENSEIALVFEKYAELSKVLHESYVILVNLIFHIFEIESFFFKFNHFC